MILAPGVDTDVIYTTSREAQEAAEKAWIEVIPYPQGLKPSLILRDLRGAEAPLYHGAAGVSEFFRSLLRTHHDGWISVSKSPPERRNPAGKAGFGSGLQAALVHNGLYLFLPPSGATWFEVPDRFLFTYRTAS